METMLWLVSADCEHAIGDERDAEKMLRIAFKAAQNHFMAPREDEQITGALNAVLVKMGDDHPDRQRLLTDIDLLAKLNAFIRACQAGVQAECPEVPEGHVSFGLSKIWREVQKEA